MSLCPEACEYTWGSERARTFLRPEVRGLASRWVKRHRLSATPGESVQSEMEKIRGGAGGGLAGENEQA